MLLFYLSINKKCKTYWVFAAGALTSHCKYGYKGTKFNIIFKGYNFYKKKIERFSAVIKMNRIKNYALDY